MADTLYSPVIEPPLFRADRGKSGGSRRETTTSCHWGGAIRIVLYESSIRSAKAKGYHPDFGFPPGDMSANCFIVPHTGHSAPDLTTTAWDTTVSGNNNLQFSHRGGHVRLYSTSCTTRHPDIEPYGPSRPGRSRQFRHLDATSVCPQPIS